MIMCALFKLIYMHYPKTTINQKNINIFYQQTLKYN